MYQLFFDTGQFDLAMYTAFCGLEKALKYKKRFLTNVANSFADVFKIAYQHGISEKFHWMQSEALNLVNDVIYEDGIDAAGFAAILRLYTSIVHSL